jgi:very-short-patch-repair endonuclease
VECDGFKTHGGRTSFERDRNRDRALRVFGFDVFRFTGRQINTQPVEVADELFSFLIATARRRGTHNFSFQRPAPRVARRRR